MFLSSRKQRGSSGFLGGEAGSSLWLSGLVCSRHRSMREIERLHSRRFSFTSSQFGAGQSLYSAAFKAPLSLPHSLWNIRRFPAVFGLLPPLHRKQNLPTPVRSCHAGLPKAHGARTVQRLAEGVGAADSRRPSAIWSPRWSPAWPNCAACCPSRRCFLILTCPQNPFI
jgi:hypothetical protein